MSTEAVVDPDTNASSAPPETPPAKTTTPGAETPQDPAPTKADPPSEPAAIEGAWGDDWREKLAKGDEKRQNVLSRYKSPDDLLEKHIRAVEKLRANENVPTLPDEPSDEDLAAYRKATGIPEAPEGYLDVLSDGLVIGEDDVEIVKEDWLPVFHKNNLKPEVASDIMAAYYEQLQRNKDAQAEEDSRYSQAAEDEMRNEWGGEYRPNANIIANHMDMLPGDLKQQLLGARTADGAPLAKNPDFNRYILEVASQMNPGGTIVPSGGESAISDMKTRKAELEDIMRTDRRRYDRDHKEEYYKIVENLERLDARR